jgi:hypothetical protein
MLRSLIPLYALIVCFCSLMCLIVALGICLYDVVRVAAPAFTASSTTAWQTDAQVLAYYPNQKDSSPDELQRFKEQLLAAALVEERRAGGQGVVFWGIIAVIDALVFALHWRIASRCVAETAGALNAVAR